MSKTTVFDHVGLSGSVNEKNPLLHPAEKSSILTVFWKVVKVGLLFGLVSVALIYALGLQDEIVFSDSSSTLLVSSTSALLKPLTPIEGTYLFENTPYKWLDPIEPGCYATWFLQDSPGLGKQKFISFVCNRDDQQWYNTSDSSWIFESYKIQSTLVYKIRNVGVAGSYMQFGESSGLDWAFLSSAQDESSRLLRVKSYEENINYVFFTLDGPDTKHLYLTQYPYGNHRTWLCAAFPQRAVFAFFPEIELEISLYDFEFSQPDAADLSGHTSQRGLIDAYTVNNDSPATLSRKIVVSEKITDAFSWGFSNSFKTGVKMSASVGIPFLGDSSIETSFEFDRTNNEQTTSTVEKSFEMSYDVSIPPHSKVTISAWYDLIKGIIMDYTAKAKITGRTKRVTVFDDLVDDAPANGEMIVNHLKYLEFNGIIVQADEDSVIVQTKGTMVASVGVRGVLNVNGKIVAEDSKPMQKY
ncbi:hypothetical protein Bhyg_12615 [Pseudolycoriella hygida]|uniref:Uncharacterized protein n=1 Tax=Pseudolycoriella hygida TaxID=35572 RepID=A0A9Q0S1C3_9DIPT|nr:hypothetical protein Bhyg_12615 [Pseudolycoriella hygida]